ncbi:MAG: hypothetical protein ACD_39C01345G0001 [uncultured bacterium]|nr:MAG: hypothetical protein ACD_39C01345G0001 [uncultured bacterium]
MQPLATTLIIRIDDAGVCEKHAIETVDSVDITRAQQHDYPGIVGQRCFGKLLPVKIKQRFIWRKNKLLGRKPALFSKFKLAN